LKFVMNLDSMLSIWMTKVGDMDITSLWRSTRGAVHSLVSLSFNIPKSLLTYLVLTALRLYGKEWKKVENHIKSRSGAQIRSHAQKFFQNIMKTKKLDENQYIAFI
jgi:SHAQKYF class myb-like DNA-binding protein